jgi:hypothetical protein
MNNLDNLVACYTNGFNDLSTAAIYRNKKLAIANALLKVYPQDTELKDKIAQIYNYEGVRLNNDKQSDKAMLYYHQSRLINPEFYWTWHNLGVRYNTKKIWLWSRLYDRLKKRQRGCTFVLCAKYQQK